MVFVTPVVRQLSCQMLTEALLRAVKRLLQFINLFRNLFANSCGWSTMALLPAGPSLYLVLVLPGKTN